MDMVMDATVTLFREANSILNGSDVSLEDLIRMTSFNLGEFREKIKKNVRKTKDVEYLFSLVRNVRHLLIYLDAWEKGKGNVTAFMDIYLCLIDEKFKDGLLYSTADAFTSFTDCKNLHEVVSTVGTWYEEFWHWAYVMSVHGGSKAMGFLREELARVGNECFQPKEKYGKNKHWSAAYQEILLEAIYFARTCSDYDKSYKKLIIGEALDYESIHVKRLAAVMAEGDLDCSKRHSLRDHRILLVYRDEHLQNINYNYTRIVEVDKGPIIKGVNSPTILQDPIRN